MTEDVFAGYPFWYRFFYMAAVFTIFRFRLYFAWTMSDAVCINAGLGAYPTASKPRCGLGPADLKALDQRYVCVGVWGWGVGGLLSAVCSVCLSCLSSAPLSSCVCLYVCVCVCVSVCLSVCLSLLCLLPLLPSSPRCVRVRGVRVQG